MSGHSKWSTIKRKKGAIDSERSKVFQKLAKELYVAAKSGDPNPENNPGLRMVIEKAKGENMPKANIESAINKAKNAGNGENYESVRYEGYGPSGVAIMIDCLTDNKNRTAGFVRSTLTKRGGNLGTDGSVSYLFERKGVLVLEKVYDEDKNLVDTLITDENGEATSKRLRIDKKYIVQESKTLENYVLNETPQTVTLTQDQITDITFTNELKKGQIRIIKVDKDNNEVKLKGVEFKVYDEDNNLVDTLTTGENGEATSKRLRIDKKYIVKESKTLENYVLNETPQTVTLTQDQITDLTFENELIKGYIRVIKVSKEDNQYNGDVKGKRLENAKFEVYDENNNLVDTLVTDENGEATTKELLKGKYTLKEVESPDYYILTDEIFEAEIVKHQEIVDVEVENDNVDIDIEVNKEGFKETQSKDSIYYDFSNIHNKSNIALDNFTWSDSLPTNALRANKIYTGTWNEDLTYSVWYKTNLSDDYIMLKDGLSTLVNNEVKFTDATLQEGEFITDFEFRFGTVKADFREVEQPRLYCDMLDNLPNGFIFVNHTKVSGNYKDIYVEDKDDWTTITYYKEIETTQKLPRTGC